MWEKLYAALKLTRQDNNIPLTIESHIQKINSLITIEDIENMKSDDVKEAVINYLQAIVPSMRK
jgi:hypothetical protein